MWCMHCSHQHLQQKEKGEIAVQKPCQNLQCSDHFWDSASNSNPKTGSHFIFRQKPNKPMFGVSVCPDFVLTLTLHPSTSTTTTYRSSPASSLYNLPHKDILFSFLYSLLLLMSILSGPNWHNTTKWHNPHNKNLLPQIWNLHHHTTLMKYSEWWYSTSNVSPQVVGHKQEEV